MIRNAFVAAAVAVGLAGAVLAQEGPATTVLSFKDLRGWEGDDHQAALETFLGTCGNLKMPDWAAVCALARNQPNARTFFELFFRPVLVEDGRPALFTGYFEPELEGARRPDARFRYPVYRKPPELREGMVWYSREEIETRGILAGRGLEIAWVDDPVELFYMQVQGSGRIRMRDGSVIRLGYAASNGRRYRSPGDEMVRRGIYEPSQVSARVIANWVRRNPVAGMRLLRSSPSYVFFRVVRGVPPEAGPLGAMNRPLTPLRSLAVDPRFVSLGAPVWVEKGGAGSFRRLMIAQDTGSAIKGAQRGDIFFGTGDEAGRAAARVNDPGRMIVLLPIEMAYARADEVAR